MANNTGLKFGGRSKGTPNKLTKETRDLLSEIVNNEIKNIPTYLEQIERPEHKLKLIAELMPYCIPKLQSINIEQEKDPAEIRVSWQRPILNIDPLSDNEDNYQTSSPFTPEK